MNVNQKQSTLKIKSHKNFKIYLILSLLSNQDFLLDDLKVQLFTT